MGLGAMTLARTRTYIERVQALLANEVVDWDFEGHERKIAFLNPDLGLIDTEAEIPLWFSAFGPKAKALSAALGAGWLNFGSHGSEVALAEAVQAWEAAGHSRETLQSNLFFLGAVLDGTNDDEKLMQQAAPQTAVVFHNYADDTGPMGGANLPEGPISNVISAYLQIHETYEPSDARYLKNHRGHLMFVRPEETHITPELVRNTTLSGTREELAERIRGLEDVGYSQVTVQLVHGHEEAIEEWADVFRAAGCEAAG